MANKKDNPLIGSFRAPVPGEPPPAGPTEDKKPTEPPKAAPDPKATGAAPSKDGEGKSQDQAGLRFVKLADIKPLSGTYVKNSPRKDYKELIDSIKKSGLEKPVILRQGEKGEYQLVDGFHRYRIMLEHEDIFEREGGMLPVSVIDKPIDQRMASTIRHNRARGSHNVDLMSNIVKELHEIGRSDAWISKHLGMDRDEILRLKQITGLAALFKDVKFGKAWRPVEEEADRGGFSR